MEPATLALVGCQSWEVQDADKIAKDISEKISVQKEIVLNFGDKILTEEGKVDRKKLKEIVFADKDKLKKLNGIIHPKVIDFYKELKEKNTDETIIFDVPLLFESGIDKFCDKILIVISDYDVQLNRIIERDNIDRELASKISEFFPLFILKILLTFFILGYNLWI